MRRLWSVTSTQKCDSTGQRGSGRRGPLVYRLRFLFGRRFPGLSLPTSLRPGLKDLARSAPGAILAVLAPRQVPSAGDLGPSHFKWDGSGSLEARFSVLGFEPSGREKRDVGAALRATNET